MERVTMSFSRRMEQESADVMIKFEKFDHFKFHHFFHQILNYNLTTLSSDIVMLICFNP